MPVRTNSEAVAALMTPGQDYPDDGSGASLDGFIATANSIVNRVATCASRKGITLSDDDLELIERWLSAHLYCQSDKPYTSRSNGGSSGSFQGQTGQGFESTLYGQTAMRVDYSGCLTAINQPGARMVWGGKPRRDQLTYDQRN